MANTTDPLARAVHGSNPQFLIEKILRLRIYENRYWKEQGFGLTAETLVDRAVKVEYIGGSSSHNVKPTPFVCLLLKLLQIQPEQAIVVEYIQQAEYKYLRALGAFYLRLVGRPADVYTHLEPLLEDLRKLAKRTPNGWELLHMDEFIDELLTGEQCCGLTLPALPKRPTLEAAGRLGPRTSSLDAELEEEEHERGRAEEGSGSAAGHAEAAAAAEAQAVLASATGGDLKRPRPCESPPANDGDAKRAKRHEEERGSGRDANERAAERDDRRDEWRHERRDDLRENDRRDGVDGGRYRGDRRDDRYQSGGGGGDRYRDDRMEDTRLREGRYGREEERAREEAPRMPARRPQRDAFGEYVDRAGRPMNRDGSARVPEPAAPREQAKAGGGGGPAENSIEYWNAERAKLGLKPLKP